jgi:hypothetical protein
MDRGNTTELRDLDYTASTAARAEQPYRKFEFYLLNDFDEAKTRKSNGDW